jgi:hypothetical protein
MDGRVAPETREGYKMKWSNAVAGRALFAVWFLLAPVLLTACAAKKDPGCGWINEEAVGKHAASYARSSRDGSVTGGHIRSMNTMLQELFEIGSCGGLRPKRGAKAMDVFKNAYFQFDGDDKVWLKALDVRRSGPVGENDSNYPSVIPPNYK